MEILGYGEDALTLWALKNRLGQILRQLGDDSEPSSCRALFRPSFGRRGGENSSQFGEFDFILLSPKRLYLGESKWDRSSEMIAEGGGLRQSQFDRHAIMAHYIWQWLSVTHEDWADFVSRAAPLPRGKPLAPIGSLLAANLEIILVKIADFYGRRPDIANVLLYLHPSGAKPTGKKLDKFSVISLEYPDSITL